MPNTRFSDIILFVAKDRQQGNKRPELKVVEDFEDSAEIHQLKATPNEASPPRKKANLRRSKEQVALLRDLSDQKEDVPLPDEAIEEGDQISTPSPALRIPPIFFIAAGGAFLLLLCLGIFMAMGGRNRDQRDKTQERARKQLALSQQEQEQARAMVETLESALVHYTSATTVEEKILYARQPERVRPLMESYYTKEDLVPVSGAKLVAQYTLPIASRSFVILTAAFDDSSNKIFLAEVDNDLNVRIDWESDVCYQPVDIAQYIAEQPTEAVTLRTYGVLDNFYVYEYADTKKYQCLKLTFRDNDEFLFGYTELGSQISEKISQYLKSASQFGKPKPQPLLLTVRFQENSMSERGVLIEKFLAPRWANIDNLEDE